MAEASVDVPMEDASVRISKKDRQDRIDGVHGLAGFWTSVTAGAAPNAWIFCIVSRYSSHSQASVSHHELIIDSPMLLSKNIQAKPAAKPAAGATPRFEIKKWNAVAMWSWDICADTVRLLFH